MKMLAVAALLCLASPCFACLWDYDTLAQEAAGMPDIKAVIAGGFPRNPPLYYEMRLERVTKLLEESPDDLDAYDAAGVACDRLGRHDEAIEWMARKQAAMERIGYDPAAHKQPNHYCRYLANLGTFHAHRWFSQGANREDMADMERGRELIAKAIEQNPDAHFGREKYQLMAMEWVIALDPDNAPATNEERLKRQTFLGISPTEYRVVDSARSVLAEHDLADALEGISGLIMLGNAWESIDAYKALALALALDGRNLVAQLANARAWELGNHGRDTVLPRTWLPQEEREQLRELTWMNLHQYSIGDVRTNLEEAYVKLRKSAEGWHWHRRTYMLNRLRMGVHPDTESDFWARFPADPNRMDVPSEKLQVFYDNLFGWMAPSVRPFGVPILAILAVLLIWLVYKVARVIRRKEPFGRIRAE